MNITAFGKTLTGSSGVNGDNFYISSDNHLFILADGASGAGKNGKVVMSSICVEVARQYDFAFSGLSPHDYLDTLLRKINQSLIEISQKENVLCFGTLVIAFIHDNEIWLTTYGDSPAYLKKNGKIIQVAQNKKRYEEIIEDGFITRQQYEGYVKNMHERMWSAFDRFLPEIVLNHVIERHTLNSGDIFMGCSDGVSDWVTPEEMFEDINERNLEELCENLVNTARSRALGQQSYYDDISVMVAVMR